MKVNINAMCNVELTKEGIEYLRRTDLTRYEISVNKETNILRTELWDIMNIFGPIMYMGQMTPLFKKNMIDIEPESAGYMLVVEPES